MNIYQVPGLQFLEVMRMVVPSNTMLNDNSQQHYRAMQGKIKRLHDLTHQHCEGETSVDGFVVPTASEVQAFHQGQPFGMVYELWKAKNIRFDLSNYGKTFKEPVDHLTNLGYWDDDNWQIMRPVVIMGGGPDQWNERYQHPETPLTGDLCHSWMVNHGYQGNDTLIRMVLFI